MIASFLVVMTLTTINENKKNGNFFEFEALF